MTNPLSHLPVQERSKKTKKDLLDALEHLLKYKSMNELTVAEIAKEASLTTGAIYRRFKDKRDMLQGAFDRFLEQTAIHNEKLAAEVKGSILSDQAIVRIMISETIYFTLDHIPLMRAAAAFNDSLSYQRMREARNLSADILSGLLTTSPLPKETLKARTKFSMRIVTAVIRDTFLAGPGAGVISSRDHLSSKDEVLIEKLTSDLLDIITPYLALPVDVGKS